VAAAESESPTIPTLTDTELPAGLRLFACGKSIVQRHSDGGVFLPVDFPERVWQEQNYDLRYHVFTTATERVTVPAVSAIDAIAKSGIDRPFKIVRGLGSDETIAAVIHAGRLIPSDQADDTDGANADVAQADAGGETDSEAVAEAGPDADVAGADADSEEPVTETEGEATAELETEVEAP